MTVDKNTVNEMLVDIMPVIKMSVDKSILAKTGKLSKLSPFLFSWQCQKTYFNCHWHWGIIS